MNKTLAVTIALVGSLFWIAPLGADDKSELVALRNRGLQLSNAGRIDEALALCEKALPLALKVDGLNHRHTASLMHNLANLYRDKGRYAEAESLYLRSRAIWEKVMGTGHPDVATSLNNLALLYSDQGKHAQAEPLFQRSLAIYEKFYRKEHPDIAESLHNLANNYSHFPEKYAQAEALHLRSLAMRERLRGKVHKDIAQSLYSLAHLYRTEGKLAAAEPLLQRSIAIYEKTLGADHPDVFRAQNSLALTYFDQGKSAEAEPLYLRCFASQKRVLGNEHPDVGVTRNNLVILYAAQRKSAELLEHFVPLGRQSRTFLLRELPRLSPGEQRMLLAEMESSRFTMALSVGFRLAQDESIRSASAAWLLNGKAIGTEAQALRAAIERDIQDAEGQGIVRRLQDLRAQEGALALRVNDAGNREAIKEQHAKIYSERRRLEKQLAQRGGAAAQPADPWVELDAVRRALPTDAVLIDIARFGPVRFGAKAEENNWRDPPRYVAWIIAAQGEIRIVDMGEAEPINAAIRSAREALAKTPARLRIDGEVKAEADATEKLAAVAKLVFEPLKPHLGGATKLILSPDGELWLLPWAALPIGKDRYLVEDYHLRLVISGRDLAAPGPRKPQELGPALVLADPDFDLTSSASGLTGQRCLGKIGTWAVSFEFNRGGDLKIWDEDNGGSLAGTGSWSLAGAKLTMKTRLAMFEGTLEARGATGKRVLQNPNGTAATDRWVLRLPDVGSQKAKLIPPAQRLPGTLLEARAAGARLKKLTGREPVVREDDEATEGAVKAAKSPALLLLATHGFFLKNQVADQKRDALNPAANGVTRSSAPTNDGSSVADPLLRCGLLLAGANRREQTRPGQDDGILTGLEVVGLDLRGTKLVVLSACDTGVGDIFMCDGVAGLRQAFQLAGAEGVLATLWPVSDEETVRVMDGFYNGIGDGGDASAALTQAQRRFIKERRERVGAAHPYFWAAFTYTGK